MTESRSSRARPLLWSLSWGVISTVASFLAILVALLTAKNPALFAWLVGVAGALAVGALTFFQTRSSDRERTGLLTQVTTLQQTATTLQEKVTTLQEKVTTLQQGLTPSVELLEPREGSGSHDSEIKIRGRVFINGLPGNAIGPILKDRDLGILLFVRPVTTTYDPAKKWYSQDPVDFDEANGEFRGSVRIGIPGPSAREEFQMVVTILPRACIPPTDTDYPELPVSILGIIASSDRRIVFRLA
jgi:hypothetical protein